MSKTDRALIYLFVIIIIIILVSALITINRDMVELAKSIEESHNFMK